jgi:hypothetical protein
MTAAPAAAGDPVGYSFVAPGVTEQHNLFRTGDGHLHALWFNFATGWHHEDRTTMTGAPAAAGDPVGYSFVAPGVTEQHNLFRTGDGHLHALWFNFATGWHHEDRTTMTGAPVPGLEEEDVGVD